MTTAQASQSQYNVQAQKTELLAFVSKNNSLQKSYNVYKKAADDFHLLELEAIQVKEKGAERAANFKFNLYNRKANVISYDLVQDLPNVVVKWDKDALARLATDMNGFQAFENLNALMDASAKGSLVEQKAAQRILLDLTKDANGKDDYKRLSQLYLDVKDVAAHTVNSRRDFRDGLELYKQQQEKNKQELTPKKKPIEAGVGKVGAVFDADHGIKLSNPADEKLDAQALLAVLDEKGVKVSADQSLKTPTFDEAALAAVKNIKQSVSLAA